MCGIHEDPGWKNPLDATAVHPESYEAAEKLLKKQGYKAEDITNHKLTGLSLTLRDYKKLAEELEIGEITLRDIVKELENRHVIHVMKCQSRFFVPMYLK